MVDVDDTAVSGISCILFERQSKDEGFVAFDWKVFLVHEFDDAAGDVESHAVVDAASGEDDLGVVAYFLGFVGEDVSGIDIEFFEDEGELVHEADVRVALDVFDGFGGLGDLDAWGEVGAGFDDGEVELVYLVRLA